MGAQRGDPREWIRFEEFYRPLVFYWCRQINSSLQHSDLQDISQDVFLKVSQGIKRFDLLGENRKFRAWLFTVTKSAVNNFLRTDIKYRQVICLADNSSQFNANASGQTNDEEEPSEMELLLHQLLKILRPEFSEQSWDIFFLFVNAGKQSKEIAEIMNMKPDTVRKIKNRMLKRIYKEWYDLGFDKELPFS